MSSNIDPHSKIQRLVPREGSVHVVRLGHRRRWREDSYARLMDTPWKWLFSGIISIYLTTNMLFACAYLAIGDGIENARPGSFADAFFFSVQTMATIGYGKLVPHGIMANLLVTLEALMGFSYFAVVTALVFAKFSRPTSRVLFSQKAVICPYNGVPHFMFRCANQRGNRIVDARVRLTVLRGETTIEGHHMRRFHDLPPVRETIPMLQLSWTVMHPLDEKSPLYNMTAEKLRETNTEIIVSISGMDETLMQTVHARYSYVAEEIACNSVFVDILRRIDDGVEVDYRLFHDVKPL